MVLEAGPSPDRGVRPMVAQAVPMPQLDHGLELDDLGVMHIIADRERAVHPEQTDKVAARARRA